jgi:23S rRNA pseudouridine1911/1915/1917 synthase
VVLNKPWGSSCTRGGASDGDLVHALARALRRGPSGIGGARRPGIVHRLDRGTSGLLVVAKNDRAHLALARQLKARTVERRYLALVHGRLPHAAGVVETAIGRDPRDRLRMAVRPAGAGRPRSRATGSSSGSRAPRPSRCSRPRSGRAARTRSACTSPSGRPVVGDRTYRRRGPMPPDPDFRRARRTTRRPGAPRRGARIHPPTTGARTASKRPRPRRSPRSSRGCARCRERRAVARVR